MPTKPPSIARALAASLRDAQLGPRDSAAVVLARRLAAELDAGGDLVKLGPQFLAVLTSLRLTPAARAAGSKGGTTDGGKSGPVDALARLRAERARAH